MPKKSINLTSSGEMGCYCAGVLAFMLETYPDQTAECLFTGASSGALLATAAVAFQKKPKDILVEFSNYYNSKRNTAFNWFHPYLTEHIIAFCREYITDRATPEEQAAILARANARLYLHYSESSIQYHNLPHSILNTWFQVPTIKVPIGMKLEGKLVNHWNNLDELYETLARSCSIPLKTCTLERAWTNGLDGGFADRCPKLISHEDGSYRWAEELKTPIYMPMPKTHYVQTCENEAIVENFIICENRWRYYNILNHLDMKFDVELQMRLYDAGFEDAQRNRHEMDLFFRQ